MAAITRWFFGVFLLLLFIYLLQDKDPFQLLSPSTPSHWSLSPVEHSAYRLPSLGAWFKPAQYSCRWKAPSTAIRTPCLSRTACCSSSYLLQRNEHFLITIHICWKSREVCRSATFVNVNVSQSSPYYNHHSQPFSVQKGNKTFLIGSYMYTNLFAAHLSY